MTDVFISYKRRLRPRVEEIAEALRGLGLSVWYDAALEVGSSFSAEISHEVRTAECVLVCWSDDAFPHGGDTHGWVVGEATIGQDRGRLVPVLLDADAQLDPPWNTIHTVDLSRWAPEATDQSGWQSVLGAIGRHVGRPGLADYASARAGTPEMLAGWAATYPDDPLATSPAASVPRGPRLPKSSTLAVVGLSTAAATGIAAALAAAIDPQLRGGYYELGVGVALCAVPLAVLFVRARVLSLMKAVLLVVAFVAAFGIGTVAGIQSIGPWRYNPADFDTAEIVLSAVAGFLGAAISLGAFPLLGLASRSLTTAMRIAASSLALSVLAGFIAAMPFYDLAVGNSAVLWMGAIWQLCYTPALVWVLRPQRLGKSG